MPVSHIVRPRWCRSWERRGGVILDEWYVMFLDHFVRDWREREGSLDCENVERDLFDLGTGGRCCLLEM